MGQTFILGCLNNVPLRLPCQAGSPSHGLGSQGKARAVRRQPGTWGEPGCGGGMQGGEGLQGCRGHCLVPGSVQPLAGGFNPLLPHFVVALVLNQGKAVLRHTKAAWKGKAPAVPGSKATSGTHAMPICWACARSTPSRSSSKPSASGSSQYY